MNPPARPASGDALVTRYPQQLPAALDDTFSPWFTCLVVWGVLNLALTACHSEGIDWKLARKIDAATVRAYQSLLITGKHGNVLQARFLPPQRGDVRIPLVVFLHGSGERGYDNIQQLKTLPVQLFHSHSFTCSVLAPQCPPGTSWNSYLPELEELIERTIRNHRIDPNRIYLTGLSMGGFGSWKLASRRPDLFAAVVPICGGGRTEWAGALKQLPIWAIHGADDTVVLPEHSRKMVTAIQSTGGSPRYTELPGVGHDSWYHAYDPDSGILKWMFQQRRLIPSPNQE